MRCVLPPSALPLSTSHVPPSHPLQARAIKNHKRAKISPYTPSLKAQNRDQKKCWKQRPSDAYLALKSLGLLLLLDLQQQRAVDVWKDTSEGDGRTDESVELLITTDGKLKVTWGDALDLEILGGILLEVRLVS